MAKTRKGAAKRLGRKGKKKAAMLARYFGLLRNGKIKGEQYQRAFDSIRKMDFSKGARKISRSEIARAARARRAILKSGGSKLERKLFSAEVKRANKTTKHLKG